MEKFSLIEKLWTPHIIGELNGQHVKLCKLKDEFVWHNHEKEDELFIFSVYYDVVEDVNYLLRVRNLIAWARIA